jgi:SAM-dependent methyltransferase
MDPRTFWDDKFRHARYAYGTAPNAFLAARYEAFAPRGAVLSLGEGEGRNAVFLAERGFDVTAIDASPEGLKKLAALAAERGVTVTTVLGDVRDAELGTERWAGIYNIYCHLAPGDRQALYPRIQAALQPGGVFLTEQFSTEQLAFSSGGPKDVSLLMTVDELTRAFAGWEMLEAAQVQVSLDEGPLHQGPASVVRFLARKP